MHKTIKFKPMSHPQVVPWKSNNELLQLQKWFFSDEDSDKVLAINRVLAYLVRGKVLAAIESTRLLTQVCLDDKKNQLDKTVVRMAYSMALIKFVNDLLDPYQKAAHAISLHGIAREIDLPSSFVEIRHIATHENLPGLEILRGLTEKALVWLRSHFWSANILDHSAPPKPASEDQEKLKQAVKAYRRHHRNGAPNGDKEYNDSMSRLREILKRPVEEALVNVLCCSNVLIMDKKDIKFESVQRLYWPLLKILDQYLEGRADLYALLFEFIVGYENFTETEITFASKWLEHFVANQLVSLELASKWLENDRLENFESVKLYIENTNHKKRKTQPTEYFFVEFQGKKPVPFGVPI